MTTTQNVVPFNLANLINSSLINGSPYEGLSEVLSQTRTRSWKERRKLKNKLKTYEYAGAVFDTRTLFSRPEAWAQATKTPGFRSGYGEAVLPSVAMAHIKQSVAGYVRSERSINSAFVEHRLKRNLSTLQNVIPIPPHSDGVRGLCKVPVPFIPKKHMPFYVREKHTIMFDTPQWQADHIHLPIPEDPYILERLDEHKFKVLSHWDLSEAERRLMALAME